jgi:hypothetical protein
MYMYPCGLSWLSNIFQLIGTLFIAFFQARVPPVLAPPLTW